MGTIARSPPSGAIPIITRKLNCNHQIFRNFIHILPSSSFLFCRVNQQSFTISTTMHGLFYFSSLELGQSTVFFHFPGFYYWKEISLRGLVGSGTTYALENFPFCEHFSAEFRVCYWQIHSRSWGIPLTVSIYVPKYAFPTPSGLNFPPIH